MKALITLFLFIIYTVTLNAQTQLTGGNRDRIFKIAGNELITLKEFKENQTPLDVELLISDGKFHFPKSVFRKTGDTKYK